MKHEITVDGLSGLEAAAFDFLQQTKQFRIFAFHAPMGAGKTTFITALCKSLGVKDDAVSSPTFSIVNEYKAADGESVFHFDFYRIEKNEEALDIGYYDYIDSGCLCFMEWPENIQDLIPEDALDVYITVLDNGSRVISWEARQ